MVDAGPYILSLALLATVALSLGYAAVRLRRHLLPTWQGPPAHLVDAIVAVALLIWLSQLLGTVGVLQPWSLVTSSLILAAAIAISLKNATAIASSLESAPPAGGGGEGCRGGAASSFSPHQQSRTAASTPGEKPSDSPAPLPPDRTRGQEPPSLASLATLAAVAFVFALWALTAADAAGRGIFNFDSLWYHMPFAVEIAQSGSTTGLHHTETVFTNWFYPQNSELLHAVAILLTERDTLSLFLNFGWLAIAFLAAWCIGRPYGKGPLTVVAAGVLLASHTLVVREPGSAKNDIMAAALILAAVAILVSAWAASRQGESSPTDGWVGWPLAAAGLAAGLAAGTKVTVLAPAAALTVAVVVLAPAGRRRAAALWWALPALAGGGYWYLRNLVVAGNPLPQVERLGPLSLPHPESLQSGRPDFSVAHYATDTGVWREYFGPGLEHAFGPLWPLVVGGAVLGALLALVAPPLVGRTAGETSRDRMLRALGAVALIGLLAYLFTPLSAAGPEGAPDAFRINLRFAIPALLAALTLLPVALLARRTNAASAGGGGEGCRGDAASSFSPQPQSRTAAGAPGEKPSDSPAPLPPDRTRGQRAWSLSTWALLGALLLVFVVTNRADAAVRDPDRLFAWALVLLLVLIPAALLHARSRGAPRGGVIAGFAVLALAIAALGYPLQRGYLDDRFANADPARAIPGMGLDSAYRWARGVEDARIGLAGTTAGFLQHGFYGTDLSNHVRYLGRQAPRGGFHPIPTCAGFRAAVNAAELDHLVTAPFLNFIEPGNPIPSPEAGWLRGDPAVSPIDREGPVTVWRIDGDLDPGACGPPNTPLRQVPQQPTG